MARGDRILIEVDPQIEGVITLLANEAVGTGLENKVEEWERPKDNDAKYEDPPYVLVREYPSAGEMSGSLAQTKADTVLRVQVLCIGRNASQARKVRDWTRRHMQRNALEALIPDRAVMDLSFMVTGGGDTRDDDLPSPFHSSTDLYELWTTPDPEEGS